MTIERRVRRLCALTDATNDLPMNQRLHLHRFGSLDGTPVLALHGFTGGGRDWEALALSAGGLWIAPDLPGHGHSPAPRELDAYRTGEAVSSMLTALTKSQLPSAPLLIGYSMGGRLALSIALCAPERFAALVLVGASPGLEDPLERVARKQRDEALADRIEADGTAAFADHWERLPILRSQQRIRPLSVRDGLRRRRREQSAHGLANSLRGMGTGAMPPRWDELGSLQLPTLLITGAEDPKFCRIARQMAARMPQARHAVIEGAGHTAQLERPEEFVRLLGGWSPQ